MAGILDSMGFSAGLGALGSMASSWMNWQSQKATNETMVNLADTAVQRRSRDMEAAGINPLLAAGSPAQTPQLGAPRVQDPVAAAFSSAGQSVNIAQTQAQTQKTAAEARSADADASLKELLTYGAKASAGAAAAAGGVGQQTALARYAKEKADSLIAVAMADNAEAFAQAKLTADQAKARAEAAGATAAEQNVEMNKVRIEQLQLARDLARKNNNWYVVQQIESILGTLLGGAKNAIGAAAGAGMLAVP